MPVTLLNTRNRVLLSTWDVSFRGLFVRSTEPLPVRRLVRFAIVTPITREELVLHGMVVNVVGAGDPEGRPRGMGVELYAVDPELRGAWWGLVRFVRDRLHEIDQASGIRAR